jgi:hypothetical protein
VGQRRLCYRCNTASLKPDRNFPAELITGDPVEKRATSTRKQNAPAAGIDIVHARREPGSIAWVDG